MNTPLKTIHQYKPKPRSCQSTEMLRNEALNGMIQNMAKELQARHHQLNLWKASCLVLTLSTVYLASYCFTLLLKACS